MKILYKKIIPKSVRVFFYTLYRSYVRTIRNFHKLLSEYFSNKIKISNENKNIKSLSPDREYFSSTHHYFEYKGVKPYWYNFEQIELRKLGYYILETEVIGQGILLSKFGEVLLESTIGQLIYLNKLNSNHLIYFKKFFRYKRLEKAIVLSNHLENNYFHWLLESIGRLTLIPTNILENYIIILHDESFSFKKESLIELFRILPKNIYIKTKYSRLKIKNTLIPTYPLTRTAKTKGTNIYNPSVIKKINNVSKSKIFISNEQNFIVSREKASQRKILNPDIILKIFPFLNFSIVLLEELTFKEQMNLFANAKIIIGTHGAGLTNLLFCTNPTIIEFFPKNRNKRDAFYFYQISQALNFKHHIIEYEAFNQSQDLKIDNHLVNKIDKILFNSDGNI